MKRRLVSLLLALTLLCSGVLFTACGGENAPGGTNAPETTEAPETTQAPSVSEVLNAALEKTQNLDSVAAEMKMEMNMAMEGMTMSIPMTAKFKVKDASSENPVMSAVVTMSLFGESFDVEMYQEGQWAYIVMEDMKYKSNVEDMESEYDYTDDADAMLQEIPEELLKDVEFVEAADGSQTATVTFTEEKFAEIYGDFIEDVNSDTEAGLEDMKISNAVVTVTVADGYVTVYDVAFTMEVTVEEMSTTTEVKATLTLEDPGKEVTITPPEGYQDFEEMGDLIWDEEMEDLTWDEEMEDLVWEE